MKRQSSVRHFWSYALVASLLTVITVFTSFPGSVFAQTGSSPPKTSTILDNYPPLEPTSVTATQNGLFQVDLSWHNDPHHTITSSRIERSTDSTFLEDTVTFVVSSSVSSYSDITVLLNKAYYYRVFALNAVGKSGPSKVASLYMSPDVAIPVSITPVAISPIVLTGTALPSGTGVVALNGSLSNKGSAKKVMAYFEWGTTARYGNTSDQSVLDTAGSFSTILKNLLPGTTYHFRAVAVGEAVGTSYGNDAVFTTNPVSSTGGSTPSNPPAIIVPVKTSTQAIPNQDVNIVSSSGKINLQLPKGSVSAPTTVEIAEYPSNPNNPGMVMVTQFDLNASMVSSGAVVTQFGQPLQITIKNAPADLAGIDTRTLRLYYLDPISGKWIPVTDSKFDISTGNLTATTTHFSHYGEMANPAIVGPGTILAAQVGLQSGSAIFTYPLELPPGPGGFQPSIYLIYNSAFLDGMKNKQDVGSWVGAGWDLNLGSITKDIETGSVSLNLNGGSYQLVSPDGINYYTQPDQYFKIVHTAGAGGSDKWELWDTGGVYYCFGGTTDSVQYLLQSDYCWNLSLWRDTNSNQATVSYVQDIKGTAPNSWVRSVHPQYLNYGSVHVAFSASYDVNDPTDGYLRSDDPKTYGSNLAPMVMENYKLDEISISFGNTLIRKYDFAYDPRTSSSFSNDYGGIYYSGNCVLHSITQIGSDNSSSLPPMVFTYQNKEIYYHDNTQGDYSGNPGNAASLFRPYLTQIASGYGGSITFAYIESPASGALNIWTREVVGSKTVNPGIGASQVINYTYANGPIYYGSGWGAQFRGFGQVTETDSSNNYIQHYFYTTGTAADGKDGEKLTGKEYDTKYYNSAATLLGEKTYNWSFSNTLIQTTGAPSASWVTSSQSTIGIAASDNDVYVLCQGQPGYYDYVVRYSSSGAQIGSWTTVQGTAGIAASSGRVYILVHAYGNYDTILSYSSSGTLLGSWSTGFQTTAQIAACSNGVFALIKIYGNYDQIYSYSATGVPLGSWSDGSQWTSSITAFSNQVYVLIQTPGNNDLIRCYSTTGAQLAAWSDGFQSTKAIAGSTNQICALITIYGNYDQLRDYSIAGAGLGSWDDGSQTTGSIAASPYRIYAMIHQSGNYDFVRSYTTAFSNYAVQLTQTDTITGNKTSQTTYSYDIYGNVITEFIDGDTSTTADDSTVWRVFYASTTWHIFDKPARERIYATSQANDNGGSNLKAETIYYYDNNSAYTTEPTKGNLTKVDQKTDANHSISTLFGYDTYGNKTSQTDPKGNVTLWRFQGTFNTYPDQKTYPAVSGGTFTENYTYDWGTNNLTNATDINGQPTTYTYDVFKRLTSIDYPLGRNPDITYDYLNWGTINQQEILIKNYIDSSNYTWQAEFFDGLGRVVQVQSNGETGRTIINSTTSFNSQGLTDKQYVSQDYASNQISGYKTPDVSWKYTSYLYDGLSRVTTQTNSDSTWVTNDYSTPWKDTVTDEMSRVTENYFDAFNRLIQVKNQFPPTVVTAAASSVTSSSATLNGNLAGLGGATSGTVSFEWGLTASYGNTTNGQGMNSTGNFNASISGLSQNTTYHFRAKVVGNDTTYGNDFTLTTPTVAPSVSSIAATGIATTSAMINGSLTSLGSSTSVNVSFEYGLTTSYGNTTSTQGLSGPSNFYAAISGLTQNTVYHYRAKAVGSSTVYGSDRTFTTLSTGGNPVEINTSVSTGTDDGFSGSGWFSYRYDTSWFEVGKPDSSTIYNAWVRFTGITIPQGAVIEAAYVTLVQSGFATGTSLKIYADDTAVPTAPSSQASHQGKARTTAGVAWTSGYSDWWWHNTPDITSVVQELVSSYSYSNGAIQILVDDNGSTTGSEATASTIEDTYAPRLYIRYHVSGGVTSPPAVGTDATGSITSSSATLNGTLASLGTASSAQVSFDWGLDLNYGNSTTTQNKTSTGTFTANLPGLAANTIYHVRAKAIGATTEYGADMVFRTSQAVGQATTTTYGYDVLGNLTLVTDANGNNTLMTYDWLSRKVTMTDPDMGSWGYVYDGNGNLTQQTDAKSQAITMTYDALNRLTVKSGTGLSVTYTFDSTTGGNYGKGLRTGMADAVSNTSHPSTYKYDAKGRLTEEIRWEYSSGAWHSYTTTYTYDDLDRIATIVYPTGETVTNSYNGRGLPYGVSGSASGNANLVGSTTYNQLGQITEIDFNNPLKTTYGYYGLTAGAPSGLYGMLWEIKTLPQAGGTALQDVQYTWDDAANVSSRVDALTSQTENFTYDNLNRLTGVSGAYSNTYTYNAIGNITSMNGVTYTYGTKPHAVTTVGSTSYAYDSNGNMTTRGNQTIQWNVENQPTSISGTSQQSLSFNGTSGYATVSSSAALKVGESSGTSASYELWVKTTATGEIIFMDKGTILPYIHDNGYLTVDFYYNNSADWYGSTNTRINDGNWHYIAATTDGTTSKIYVDGVLKASHTVNDYLTNAGSQALYIGKASWGGYYVSGQMDEMRISSSARTQTEITNAWNSGNGNSLSVDGSTVALYHCDDQASSLTDATSNNFTGTMYNMTYTTGFPFSGGGGSGATFTYDGDGKRILKTENGQTIFYANQYYEKNLTSSVATTYYFLGSKEIAEREGTTLRFMHGDGLGSVSLVTLSDASHSSLSYYPFGAAKSGSVPTDEKFTGQRLDSSTGLYYYNARYYDPTIGRFVSPDSFVQSYQGSDTASRGLTVSCSTFLKPFSQNPELISSSPMNPQTLNRYSYVLNNPLVFTDPTGNFSWKRAILIGFGAALVITTGLVAAWALPLVAAEIGTAFATASTGVALIEAVETASVLTIGYVGPTLFGIGSGSYLIAKGVDDDGNGNLQIENATPALPNLDANDDSNSIDVNIGDQFVGKTRASGILWS